MTSDPHSETRPGWDDETLTGLLERGVADVTDGPAPVQVVVDDGARVVRRRRQTVAVCCATLAVGAVALTASLLGAAGDSTTHGDEPDLATTPTTSPDDAPTSSPDDGTVPTLPLPIVGPVSSVAIQGNWIIASMRNFGVVGGFNDDFIEPEDFTMTFTGDQWTAKTGCYSMSAQFDLADGDFTYRDPMNGSGSRCPQDTVESDWIANISNIMMRTDRITGGPYESLSLRANKAVVATLVRVVDQAPPEPGDATAADMVGRWNVTIAGLVVNGESQVDTSDDVAMTLELTADGRLSGGAGCADLTGGYSVAGRDVLLNATPILVRCNREPPLAKRLSEVRHATTGPHGQIYLHAANYEIVVVLKPL